MYNRDAPVVFFLSTQVLSFFASILFLLCSFLLEPSYECSEFITKSFKNELDPNGFNRKNVSNEFKKFYFGEFKAVKKGRDPTPNELHLHVHTHGNDGKSFVAVKSRIIHELVTVIVERVRKLVSLPSHQPNTDMAHTVPTSSTAANIDEVHALGSDDDRNSPA